jgi:hypothetical protein
MRAGQIGRRFGNGSSQSDATITLDSASWRFNREGAPDQPAPRCPLVRQDKFGCSRELKGVHLEVARSSSSRLSGRRSNPSFEASKGEDMSRKY